MGVNFGRMMSSVGYTRAHFRAYIYIYMYSLHPWVSRTRAIVCLKRVRLGEYQRTFFWQNSARRGMRECNLAGKLNQLSTVDTLCRFLRRELRMEIRPAGGMEINYNVIARELRCRLPSLPAGSPLRQAPRISFRRIPQSLHVRSTQISRKLKIAPLTTLWDAPWC
jgi:hypothetical protein